MNSKTLTALFCGLAITLAAWQTTAEPYEITWYTMDGGGGTSVGGNYQLSGTIGQHDAGALTGGDYVLQGGFWGWSMIIAPPLVPALSISLVGNQVIVAWSSTASGFLLQQKNTLNASAWTQVPTVPGNSEGVYYVNFPLTADSQFFRLEKP